MKEKTSFCDSKDDIFTQHRGNNLPELGQIKIYLSLIWPEKGFENIIIWSHFTPKIVLQNFLQKTTTEIRRPSKLEIVKINKEIYFKSIKENNTIKMENSEFTSRFDPDTPISQQITNFNLIDNSFFEGDEVLCLAKKKSYIKANSLLLSNDLAYKLECGGIFGNIKEKMENSIKPLELPWDYLTENDNLVNLYHLNEEIIIKELRERFRSGKFYTFIDNILIFLNPFFYVPLYNPKYSNKYRNHTIGKLPPHIFSIADHAYYRLLKNGRPQCIIISGESGSGKTEATKQIIQHLTYLSQYGETSPLVSGVLASSQVLEAFGNAYTYQNDNSSRFGKFTEILFEADGSMQGARLKKHLLEKSRIVRHDRREQNYHVFYFLINGADEETRRLLDLGPVDSYEYLLPILDTPRANIDEHFELKLLKSSLADLCFDENIQQRIFAILSAILLIGNIKKNDSNSHAESPNGNIDPYVIRASALLMIDPYSFEKLITLQQHYIKAEKITLLFSAHKTKVVRDTISKLLYSSLFEWIVEKINERLKNYEGKISENKFQLRILDIFGFENNVENSFEQFCINYANETLQMHMTQQTFKQQQDEYEAEGLDWTRIPYQDNTGCVRLYSSKINGLFRLIEDECMLSNGSDANLLEKISSLHKNSTIISVENFKTHHFSIKHYASSVTYNINGFREKNSNYVHPEILQLLCRSKCRLVRQVVDYNSTSYLWRKVKIKFRAIYLFFNGRYVPRSQNNSSQMIQEKNATNKDIKKNSNFKFKRERSIVTVREYVQGVEKKIPQATNNELLSAKKTLQNKSYFITSLFQNSLNSLMNVLSSSETHFVRCIRPNYNLAPLIFDPIAVTTQLKYTGLIQMIHVRQAGFSHRFLKQEFISKYRILISDYQNDITELFKGLKISSDNYFIGKNKIFIRESTKLKLNVARGMKIKQHIHCIQRNCRFFVKIQALKKTIKASMIIQIYLKTIKCIKQFNKLKNQTSVLSIEILKSITESTTDEYRSSLKSDDFRDMILSMTSELNKNVDSLEIGSVKTDSLSIESNSRLSNRCNSYDSTDLKSLQMVRDLQNQETDEFSSDKDDAFEKEKNIMKDPTSNDNEEINFDSSDQKGKTIDKHTLRELKKRQSSSNSTNNILTNSIGFIRSSTKQHSRKHLSPYLSIFKISGPPTTKTTTNDISNLVQLYSYYNYLSLKIPKLTKKRDSKNLEKNGNQMLLENLFVKCISRHAAFIFVKLKCFIETSNFIPISFDELFNNFEQICKEDMTNFDISAVSIVSLKSAFEVILNGFFNRRANTSLNKDFEKFMKDVKEKKMLMESNHSMKPIKLYNYTACDVCTTKMIGRVYKCKDCHVLVHKKCITKIKPDCTVSNVKHHTNKLFGLPLNNIASKTVLIPSKLIKLFNEIELRGTNTEGIYRISGKATDVKHLHSLLDTLSDHDSTVFADYGIHVLTTLAKSFFRELPEPLIPNEFTDDLIRASQLEEIEAHKRYEKIISAFPILNRILLDYLCNHLAIISSNSEVNKMTPNTLSIIFTPCLFFQPEIEEMTYFEKLAQKTKTLQRLIEIKLFFIQSGEAFILGDEEVPEKFFKRLSQSATN